MPRDCFYPVGVLFKGPHVCFLTRKQIPNGTKIFPSTLRTKMRKGRGKLPSPILRCPYTQVSPFPLTVPQPKGHGSSWIWWAERKENQVVQLISPLLSPPIGPSHQPSLTPTSQLAPASAPFPQTSCEAPPSVPASHHTVSSASPVSQPPGRDQSTGLEARLFWVQITNLLFCGCMTLSKLISLSLGFLMCKIRMITPTL